MAAAAVTLSLSVLSICTEKIWVAAASSGEDRLLPLRSVGESSLNFKWLNREAEDYWRKPVYETLGKRIIYEYTAHKSSLY